MLEFIRRSLKMFSPTYARKGFVKALRSRQFAKEAQPDKESKTYLLLLIIPATTFGLGTWQVFRLQWKKGLIKELEERTTAAPIEMPDNIEDLDTKSLEYHRLKLKGRFDNSTEFHVLPRSLNEGRHSPGGLGWKPKSGSHVITPFVLAGSGQKILINRGWVPRNKIDPDTRQEGQVEHEIELVGFIRKNEKRAPFAPNNDIETNRWHHCDVEAMAEIAGCWPVRVDADAGSTVPGGPIGGQTRVYLRNEHLQYLITWYALSAATAFMYYRLRKKPNSAFG